MSDLNYENGGAQSSPASGIVSTRTIGNRRNVRRAFESTPPSSMRISTRDTTAAVKVNTSIRNPLHIASKHHQVSVTRGHRTPRDPNRLSLKPQLPHSLPVSRSVSSLNHSSVDSTNAVIGPIQFTSLSPQQLTSKLRQLQKSEQCNVEDLKMEDI
mmetsp:Transcript_19165/g.31609  ORF Transcript_19165/g.31609 Transcript_19165/m.31609 type:complete len:156 (+) Transcript_19165:1013-1480(+)